MLFLRNAEDYVRRIRSHASIALYCGRNEGFPPEAIDRKLREYVHTLSPGMDYISHSSSEGVSGGGPYRALPMKEYFSRQSGKIHSFLQSRGIGPREDNTGKVAKEIRQLSIADLPLSEAQIDLDGNITLKK